ncbi:MAG: hypothetical protein ACREI7_07000, partial [Myxococcota bacterium]
AVILALGSYQGIRLAKATSQRESLRSDLTSAAQTLEEAQREIAALRRTDAALRAQLRGLGAEPVVPEVRVAPGPAPDVSVIVPSDRPSRAPSTPAPTPTPRPCLLGLICP